MSITLYWFSNEWKMYCILLDLIPLHERNTGIILANMIYNIINNFDLGKKIISVTTDNASNMDIIRHEFVLKDGLNIASSSIKKIREFTNAIRLSQVLFEELKKIFEIKQCSFLVPEIVTSNLLLLNIYLTNMDWQELE
ncbi:773_t:CDS:2, partial [Gigaspora rosea]